MKIPSFIRRYALFRREGLYYLVVLAFILGGAMLREVNPLLMLGGMMVGVLVVSWRWAAASLRHLSVRHRLPAQLVAGSPARIGIELSTNRRWFASWAVWIDERIERLESNGDIDATHSAAATVFIPRIMEAVPAEGVYRCLLTRRGRYRFGKLRLSTAFPLGFLRAFRHLDDWSEAIVHPKLGQMDRDWLGYLQSEGESRLHSRAGRNGFSEGDFYAIRDWRSGDSRRWIHWRTTARLNHLAVRMFERQQSRDYVLLVDLHRPQVPSQHELQRVEQAISFAATLASELCRNGSGKLSLVVAGKQNEAVHGAATAGLLRSMLDRLALAEATDEVHLAEAGQMARAEAASGAPVIVITSRPEHSLPSWIDGDVEPNSLANEESPTGSESMPTLSKSTGTFVVSVDSELYHRCFRLEN